RAYLAVRWDEAAARLTDGRNLALEVASAPGAVRLIAEVTLRLGAVELARGRSADADRAFRLASILAPDRSVTDVEFMPAVVAAFAAAQARPAVPTKVSFACATDATLVVDGVDLGRGPRTAELDRGLHLVAATAPGRREHGALVD